MHLHSSNLAKYLVGLLRTSFFFPFGDNLLLSGVNVASNCIISVAGLLIMAQLINLIKYAITLPLHLCLPPCSFSLQIKLFR